MCLVEASLLQSHSRHHRKTEERGCEQLVLPAAKISILNSQEDGPENGQTEDLQHQPLGMLLRRTELQRRETFFGAPDMVL